MWDNKSAPTANKVCCSQTNQKSSAHICSGLSACVSAPLPLAVWLLSARTVNTRRGATRAAGPARRARGAIRLVAFCRNASSSASQMHMKSKLRYMSGTERILRHILPREQLILRPAMLLLLAVRFEHVKEAMALRI